MNAKIRHIFTYNFYVLITSSKRHCLPMTFAKYKVETAETVKDIEMSYTSYNSR